MSYTPELVAELEVLRQFNLENLQEGLNVDLESTPTTNPPLARLDATATVTSSRACSGTP